jgi:AcrR family transcriptional regulator
MDRRKIRTRRLLRESLLSLIVERGYDNLSITEITERADLRRATFYLHYGSVDELLLATLREIFDELANKIEARQNLQPFWLRSEAPPIQAVFEYLAQNARLYHALLSGASGAMVQRSIRDYLASIKLKDLATLPVSALPMPAQVLANYIAGTECNMLVWWLETGMPYAPEEIAGMLQDLVLDGTAGLQNLALEKVS